MPYRYYRAAAGMAPVQLDHRAYGVPFRTYDAKDLRWKPRIASFQAAQYVEIGAMPRSPPAFGNIGDRLGAYTRGLQGCIALMLGASAKQRFGQPPFESFYFRHCYGVSNGLPNLQSFAGQTAAPDCRAVVAASSKSNGKVFAEYLLSSLKNCDDRDDEIFLLEPENVLIYFPQHGDVGTMGMNFRHGTFGHIGPD